MPTSIFLILLVLVVCSAAVLIVGLMGNRGIDYWDLDGSNEPPESRLDFLRKPAVFYSAAVILVASAIVYLWWKAHLLA
jgi:hypothetical protein